MATPTYDLVAETVLASTASVISFTNLDTLASGYKHLAVTLQCEPVTNFNRINMTLNGVFTSNRKTVSLYYSNIVDSTTKVGTSFQLPTFSTSGFRTGDDSIAIFDFFDFANSNNQTCFLGRVGNEQEGWEITANFAVNGVDRPVTRIDFNMNSGDFVVGSSAKIFGLAG